MNGRKINITGGVSGPELPNYLIYLVFGVVWENKFRYQQQWNGGVIAFNGDK